MCKKMEAILLGYNNKLAAINNLYIDLKNMENSFNGAGSIDYNKERVSNTYKITSCVEDEAVRRERDKEEFIRIIKIKESELQKIDNAIMTLDEEEQIFVNLRYKNKLRLKDVADRMKLSERTTMRKRRKILDSLANILNITDNKEMA